MNDISHKCVRFYVRCRACVLFYVLSSFHFRISPALKVIYTRPPHSPSVFLGLCAFLCVPTAFCSRVCMTFVYVLAQKVPFFIRPSAPTNHFHLYFLFFSIYQLFTELKPLSPRYGGDLALFSSYSSYVTSASISNIPSTDALVCFSTHCKCMCTLDCSHLPGPGWTQAMTHMLVSHGSEDLERLT